MAFTVSLARCTDYSPGLLAAALEEVLAPLGGIRDHVSPGDRVLIKPNLLAPKRPEDAVTTHPQLVKAVILKIQEHGAVPVVGDSPGGRNTRASYRALLKKTGIQQVLDETGVEPVYFDEPTITVSSERAQTFRKMTVAGILDEVDAVVCLPKLKTHIFTYYTGAVKLLYGYIPGILKAEYHLHAGRDVATFADLLLDLNETFPPALSIMDAVVGMEGSGPQHGDPRRIGLLLASASSTALDFVAATIIGIDPLSVPTITRAADRIIGPQSLDEIAIYGPSIGDIAIDDFALPATLDIGHIPPFLFTIAQRVAAIRPVINPGRCIMCGKCTEDCPPSAIRQEPGGVPHIDYRQCIRCFCCHELCPVGAISVKRPLLRRFL